MDAGPCASPFRNLDDRMLAFGGGDGNPPAGSPGDVHQERFGRPIRRIRAAHDLDGPPGPQFPRRPLQRAVRGARGPAVIGVATVCRVYVGNGRRRVLRRAASRWSTGRNRTARAGDQQQERFSASGDPSDRMLRPSGLRDWRPRRSPLLRPVRQFHGGAPTLCLATAERTPWSPGALTLAGRPVGTRSPFTAAQGENSCSSPFRDPGARDTGTLPPPHVRFVTNDYKAVYGAGEVGSAGSGSYKFLCTR